MQAPLAPSPGIGMSRPPVINTMPSNFSGAQSSSSSQANQPIADLQKQMHYYEMKFNTMVDQTTPYTMYRWIGTGLLFTIFMMRILIAHGWYLITYALGIYLLNLFLAFLSPKFDPSLEMESISNDESVKESAGDMPSLPTSSRDQEFRPFIRRLPEFKFWYAATKGIAISLFLSFFAFTDVPVFWPILLIYFIMLTFLTLKRQIRHMLKYNYIPLDIGKKKYSSS